MFKKLVHLHPGLCQNLKEGTDQWSCYQFKRGEMWNKYEYLNICVFFKLEQYIFQEITHF